MSKKHVIAEINGGLGNQMFMYAAARALALRNNAELCLEYDDTGVKDGYGRLYELSAFNIAGHHPSCLSYSTFYGKFLRKVFNRTGIKIPYYPTTIVKEKEGFDFEPKLLRLEAKNIYLQGYWQTDKYFHDFEKEIRQDFEFKISFSQEVEEEKKLIESYGDRAVAFCVRRYQEVKQFIHLKRAEKKYYQDALNELKQRVAEPVLFCFSQTPEWVKEEFSNRGIEIIYIKPKFGKYASHEDLYLLRGFKNYLISNSSYYWWGAWLSSAENKLVISPDNWCCNESNCKDWIVIK